MTPSETTMRCRTRRLLKSFADLTRCRAVETNLASSCSAHVVKKSGGFGTPLHTKFRSCQRELESLFSRTRCFQPFMCSINLQFRASPPTPPPASPPRSTTIAKLSGPCLTALSCHHIVVLLLWAMLQAIEYSTRGLAS
jgi:hypothetical protein